MNRQYRSQLLLISLYAIKRLLGGCATGIQDKSLRSIIHKGQTPVQHPLSCFYCMLSECGFALQKPQTII